MRAAVCRAFGQPLQCEDISLSPLAADDELVVRIAACAICHSDVIFADGGWGGDLPAVYGHEAAGIVEEAGSTSGYRTGDRVVVTLVNHCGSCHCCGQGLPGACEAPPALKGVLRDADGVAVTQAMMTGAFAERVRVRAAQVVRLDADMPAAEASLLACGVLTGWGAVSHAAKPAQNESIAVIGCGGVGLNAIQSAAHATHAPVIAIDINEDKLAAARAMGATHVINSRTVDPANALRHVNGGQLVRHVLVTVGAPKVMEAAMDYVAPGGQLVIVGLGHSDVRIEYDPVNLASYAQKIIGSKMGNAPIAQLIPELIGRYQSGQLKLAPLITRQLPLTDINDAMDQMRRGEGLRSVIMFEGAGW